MKTMQLSWDLQKASLAARTGTGVVSGLAIFSLTVCSWIAFIVAGGTWMFWERLQHMHELGVEVHESRDYVDIYQVYVALALIACGFLFPAIFALTSQTAVLGASGREQRLAALRLIGLSSRDITKITAVETGLQSVAGVVLGFALSILTAPLGTRFSFQNEQIGVTELYLPWWGYLAVAGILVLIALTSSVVGMQRVLVSPLGVARREMPRTLRWWRFILTLVVVIAGLVWMNLSSFSNSANILVAAFVIFLMVSALNVGVPFVLQIWFRLVGLLPGTAHFVATRRIFTDARSAWRRSSATAFYGVLVGVLIISPRGDDEFSTLLREEADVSLMFHDLNTGVMITLLIGFIIAAVATLLGQASEVFEKAALTRALSSLGVPRYFHFGVAFFQIMGPVVLVSLCGFLLGGGMMFALFGAAGDMDVPARAMNAFIFLVAGWALTLVALLAVEPLRSRVIASGGRRND